MKRLGFVYKKPVALKTQADEEAQQAFIDMYEARLCTKSSTSTRPRPENFVCGDFVPCLLKGKMIPPKSPPSRYWLLHRMRDCGSRCSLNSSRLMT